MAIAGDFNAWAVDWGSKRTNGKGRSLLEAMSALEVVLLNAGSEPTFISGAATSIVDLTVVSSSLIRGNRSSWKVSDVYTHRNHQAIVWEINGDPKKRGEHHRMNSRRWRGKLFGADLFHEALDTHRSGLAMRRQKWRKSCRGSPKQCREKKIWTADLRYICEVKRLLGFVRSCTELGGRHNELEENTRTTQ